mmetsp:Transcript_38530/g.79031  ORF Transcript_38530/g.79031 Transcript_38530/m.79031 type:complete len:422 (-) Transcript_38530:157-1422(-)
MVHAPSDSPFQTAASAVIWIVAWPFRMCMAAVFGAWSIQKQYFPRVAGSVKETILQVHEQRRAARLASHECTAFEPIMDQYRPKISEMFKKHDADGNGHIDKHEFETLVVDVLHFLDPSLPPEISREDKELIRELIDKDRNNQISEEELFESLKEWIPTIGGGRRALIVVDLQNDFITGSLQVPNAIDAVHATNALRQQFVFDVVAHTRDWHPKNHCSFASTNKQQLFTSIYMTLEDGSVVEQMMWPDHCVQDTHGAKFCPELILEAGDVIIDKGTKIGIDSYSGFFDNCKQGETLLQKQLKSLDVGEVYVCGVAMDYCVGCTALDAALCGFTTYLLEDCSKPVSEESWEKMRTRLEQNEVQIISSHMVPMPRRPTGRNTLEAARRLLSRRKEPAHRCNGGHNMARSASAEVAIDIRSKEL